MSAATPSPMSARPLSQDGGGASPPSDLRLYATVVRRRKWSVIFVLTLMVGAAVFMSYRQTPLFQSTATVLVKPLRASEILEGANWGFTMSMQTEQSLATSPAVATLAAELVRSRGGTGLEPGTASADVPGETTFLLISYSSPDAAASAQWAQAYAEAYATFRGEDAKAQYEEALRVYQAEIDDMNEAIAAKQAELAAAGSMIKKDAIRADMATLNQRRSDLNRQVAQIPFPASDSAAEVIADATVAAAPYSPDWTRNIALAVVVGLALGLGLAFVRERLDDRIASRDELEEASGAPVLAVVPSVSGWRRRKTRLITQEAPKSGASEAYRTIRTNVNFLSKTSGLRVAAIASPGMGEGKTTTTANLAVALAQSGKRVIAVSCDLRKPRLHTFFGLRNDVGVTGVLMDGLTIPQVAQRVTGAGMDTLRIIASGPVPHNPAELLGSEAMDELLRELHRYAEYVLIDTAPILAVSDGIILAPKCDGVILVADASTTHRSAVRAARDQLEQVGANMVGAVFNNFDPSKSKSYPGYYRYGYYGKSKYHDDKSPARPMRDVPAVDPAEFWQ